MKALKLRSFDKAKKILKSDPRLSQENCFVCFKESQLKMMKSTFYFILKAFFFLKVFNFLS